jgi:hypothetical protein
LRLAWILVLCLLPLGCGKSDDCGDYDWQVPADGGVICRGAEGCLCATGSLCCMEMEGDRIQPGTCAATCGGLTFTCDGPEDCALGEVCCATYSAGGGSRCVAITGCPLGDNQTIMCRAGAHCPMDTHCLPGGHGSIFEGIAGYCSP